jgi:hypothetical protein
MSFGKHSGKSFSSKIEEKKPFDKCSFCESPALVGKGVCVKHLSGKGTTYSTKYDSRRNRNRNNNF